LDQVGKTFVPRRRSVLTRMTGQQPRRPQLVWIAVLLGLVAPPQIPARPSPPA
jgi:hypothetical protein